MYSLKHRIARNLALNLVAVMACLVFAIYLFVQHLLQDYMLTQLQHDAESLVSAIYREESGPWKIDPGRMSAVYSRVRSGHYYYVVIGQQVIYSRSLFDAEFPGIDDELPAAGEYLAAGPGDERWLIWHQAVTRDGQPMKLWIAEDIAPFQSRLVRYAAVVAGLIVVVAALLFFLQQRTLRRAFDVFDWLRLNLATIRQGGTGKTVVPMPLEVAPLVAEIEKLVEHLGHRTVRTRNAMGNLAHELKRPLQLLAIQREGGQIDEMQDTLDEIRQILEGELRRARISGSSGTGAAFDATEEIEFMTGLLRRIYPDIDIESIVEGPVETPGLDRDDMLELIGNLFDNACKFARSSARLTVGLAENRLELAFDDDGQGLEAAQMQQLNRRGQRLDERVTGHGLGLGICRDILDYYRGELAFSKSALGGLRVEVCIPLNSSPL